MNLEDELRAALRREDPSPGFAERVVARAQSSARPSSRDAPNDVGRGDRRDAGDRIRGDVRISCR